MSILNPSKNSFECNCIAFLVVVFISLGDGQNLLLDVQNSIFGVSIFQNKIWLISIILREIQNNFMGSLFLKGITITRVIMNDFLI